MEKVIVAAANGFIGQHLVLELSKKYRVITLTRRPIQIKGAAENIIWDGKNLGFWCNELEGSLAVINLTGKSVNCRWNEANKKAILNSRLESTKLIGQAIEKCKEPPSVWINASGVSIYKETFGDLQTESATEMADDFLADVTKQWEDACFSSKSNIRKVVMRTSVVLGNDGGSFPIMRKLTGVLLGGKLGSGKQFFSWIHIDDYCKIVAEQIIPNEKITGPINMAAPESVTNTEFMKSLRKAMKVPFGIPTPKFLLKIGASIIGTEPSLVLKSTCVVSEVLKQNGYEFCYPQVDSALEALVGQKKT